MKPLPWDTHQNPRILDLDAGSFWHDTVWDALKETRRITAADAAGLYVSDSSGMFVRYRTSDAGISDLPERISGQLIGQNGRRVSFGQIAHTAKKAGKLLIAHLEVCAGRTGLLIAMRNSNHGFTHADARRLALFSRILETTLVKLGGKKNFFNTSAQRMDEFELPGRVELLEELERRHRDYLQNGTNYAVVVLDIDNFRAINANYGFGVGDALLAQVGQRFLTLRGENIFMARYSDDNFAVLTSPAHRREAIRFSVLSVTLLSSTYSVNDTNVYISVTAGLSFATPGWPDGYRTLLSAEIAMEQARLHPHRALSIYKEEMMQSAAQRIRIETDLREAISGEQLSLYYQPILNSAGRVRIMEGLLRWQHPRLGLQMPGSFFPVIQDSRTLHVLGHWIIHEGCRQIKAWNDKGLGVQIAINISPIQLKARNFAVKVRESMLKLEVQPGDLILELTEGSLLEIDRDPCVRRNVDMLRQMGVQIAIDDFGSGFSSLSNLYTYPADLFKVDRSLVSNLNDSYCQVLMRNILNLLRDLEKPIVVEGIETMEQERFLRGFNPLLYQGYLYSKPMDRELALDYLMSRKES